MKRSTLCAWLFLFLAPAAGYAETRVATLIPFVADATEQLGDGVRLVASVRSGVGVAPDGVEDLGSPHAPSLEVLAAMRPDVLVVDRNMHAALDGLDAVARQVVRVDTGSVDSTLHGLVQLAEAAGQPDAMQTLIEAVRRGIDNARLERPVRALTLYASPGQPVVVTRRTWIGDLLQRVGIEDATEGITGRATYPGYVHFSVEVLATLRPDWIFLVTHSDPETSLQTFRDRMRDNPVWKHLREAVRDRVVVLEPRWFGSNPGLGFDHAATWLAERVRSDAR